MKIEVGSTAPDFSLFNTDKEKVTLNELKGNNVLLLFFPQSFTGVCTAELCSIRDNIAMYNSVNAKVFGISVDSIFTLGKFKEEQKLNFPLLSDFNKEASTAYDCIYTDWILDMKGVSKRSAFVINADGKITYAEVLESAGDLPNFEAIKTILSA
jgi:glutaredoxin-dependent peroxiredoxin